MTAPAQRILDDKGYLVFATYEAVETGQILAGLDATPFDDVPGPLVVIGPTTFDEWFAQFCTYIAGEAVDERELSEPDLRMYGLFYRAIAE